MQKDVSTLSRVAEIVPSRMMDRRTFWLSRTKLLFLVEPDQVAFGGTFLAFRVAA